MLRETAARERAEERQRARGGGRGERGEDARVRRETVMRGEMERRAAVETMRRGCEERERARERECGMKIADAKAACERRREGDGTGEGRGAGTRARGARENRAARRGGGARVEERVGV